MAYQTTRAEELIKYDIIWFLCIIWDKLLLEGQLQI